MKNDDQAIFEKADALPVVASRMYRADYFGWLEDQLALLKAGRIAEVDSENIADEIGDIASRESDRLDDALRALTFNVMKWDLLPDRRSGSMVLSIDAHRRQVAAILERNPSLIGKLNEAADSAYTFATYDMMRDSGLAESIFVSQSPYDPEALRWREFRFENFVSPSGVVSL